MTKKHQMADTPLTPEQVIQKRRREALNKADIQSFLFRLVVMILVIVLLFGIIFGITPMKDNDMKPRIFSGDLIFYYRLENRVDISDVFVYEKEGKQYIGRIIAQGGDTVEITKTANLKLNGNLILENDIFYTTPQYEDGIEYPVTLEENQYFILCDYREGGQDSRYFGPVTKEELKGKVIAVIRRSGL